MKIIVEDYIDKFHVIDLSDYVEVAIDPVVYNWATSGHYNVVKVRKRWSDESIEYNVDVGDVEKYKFCMRHRISSDEYDTYKRVKGIKGER